MHMTFNPDAICEKTANCDKNIKIGEHLLNININHIGWGVIMSCKVVGIQDGSCYKK